MESSRTPNSGSMLSSCLYWQPSPHQKEPIVWRKCDFHRHTISDDPTALSLPPQEFVQACLDDGLDVVAVTDHNILHDLSSIRGLADQHDLVLLPGIEINTDRGHILVLAPDVDGQEVIAEFIQRVPIHKGNGAQFADLIKSWTEPRTSTDTLFRDHLLLIAAHADADGSILSSTQPSSITDQIDAVRQLDAIEVVRPTTLANWRSGIKQTKVVKPLIRGSDFHPYGNSERRSTWLYLPEVDLRSIRHAFATPEASISHELSPPSGPEFWIKSIRIENGPYDGRHISFSPRANAIIGPPSSGKSLIIDAIQYVFAQSSDIADVRASVDRRLESCLPRGSAVIVEVCENENIRELRRIRGGTDLPEIRDYPISFSQSELARRAMEPIPSVQLLDLHCPEAENVRKRIADLTKKVEECFQKLVADASNANSLRRIVDNEQEGITVTRAAYLALVGNDENAQMLKDLASIELWQQESLRRLNTWRDDLQSPAGPSLATVPALDTDLELAKYVPKDVLDEPLQEFKSAVQNAADELQSTLRGAIQALQPNTVALRTDVQSKLGSDQSATPEMSEQASKLKDKLVQLEQESIDLSQTDSNIEKGLEAIGTLVDEAEQQWVRLRLARKTACSEVNTSMVGFFVKLTKDSQTEGIDDLLSELRTGTHIQVQTLNALRDSLDRKSFVAKAIRSVQYSSSSGNSSHAEDGNDNVARVAAEAMRRSKHKEICELAVTWPDDGIDLVLKEDGGAMVNFDELTEGLKALAIKEISMAASQRPAVTDQPEDAVPTAAVFEKLVPTIRQQRSDRQFIIASHDANIVVSGDMENVIVLPPDPNEVPIQGTLFDKKIRGHAVKLLEGGKEAFILRRERYGEYERE